MKLIIVRHAETIENKRKLMQGQIQGNLSRKGKQQAKKLAKRLAKEKIDLIYCSDLRRCKQTIKPFLEKNKVPIIYTKEIRERSWGKFDGKPISKFIKWIKSNNYINNYKFKIPLGESFQDVKKRASKFIRKIIKKDKDKTILLMTHGAFKVALMLSLFNKNEQTYYTKYRAPNAAISVVNIKENGFCKARLLNSVSHL